jgi:hypothetical protein
LDISYWKGFDIKIGYQIKEEEAQKKSFQKRQVVGWADIPDWTAPLCEITCFPDTTSSARSLPWIVPLLPLTP